MDSYVPPFQITNNIVRLISSISEKVGKLDAYRSFEVKPQLRRNNRIKSVHSSLKIESNTLSEGVIRSVLNNKAVIGPQKEIQEVKNAFSAYEKIDEVEPYNMDDLKKLHGIMTYLTVDDSGSFRKTAEGVFDGDRCIFMAPPADMVPILMHSLFSWMKQNQKSVHPLVMSCVFHYEFVFIHPFSDGNGRMARLWQTIILSKWNPIFKYVPIESQIEKFQDRYYDAINICNGNGASTVFIEFMLERIDEVLSDVLTQNSSEAGISEYVKKLLSVMEYDTCYTMGDLLELLHLKSRETLRRNYLEPAMKLSLVTMEYPDKPTSRNQRYIKI